MCKVLKNEHSGFAITLEVLFTLCTLFTFLTMFLYITRVMNLQRYMNTCLTSAAIQAARYGGNNTKAFHENVHSGSVSAYYTDKLNSIAKDYSGTFTGAQANLYLQISPEKIEYDTEPIHLTLTYTIPGVFSSYSKIGHYDMYDGNSKTIRLTVNSIMKAGDLLND